MKFIKGFVVTIALYLGLSLLFQFLASFLSSSPLVIDPFASLGSLGVTFHLSLSQPVIMSTFANIILFIALPTDMALLFQILGSVVPVIVAALVGSLAEKKSGSVKYIFLSTFVGLLIAALIGMIFYIVDGGMLLGVDYVSKYLTSGLIMSALNAFIWCAIGVFVTSKGWG